jgi:truncated hemoglobin YjbI
VVYTGKKIDEAHAHARSLGLNDKHFDAFLKHFRATLDEVGVKPDKAERVMKLLETQRDTVLDRLGSHAFTPCGSVWCGSPSTIPTTFSS